MTGDFTLKRSVSVYKSVSDYQTVYENENEIDNLKNTETAKDTEAGDQNKPQFLLIDSNVIDWSSKNTLKEIQFLQAAQMRGFI